MVKTNKIIDLYLIGAKFQGHRNDFCKLIKENLDIDFERPSGARYHHKGAIEKLVQQPLNFKYIYLGFKHDRAIHCHIIHSIREKIEKSRLDILYKVIGLRDFLDENYRAELNKLTFDLIVIYDFSDRKIKQENQRSIIRFFKLSSASFLFLGHDILGGCPSKQKFIDIFEAKPVKKWMINDN